MTLVCPRAIHERLLEHASAGAPLEVCGVLGGSFDPVESRVESHHPLENVARDPRRRYEIDPEAALECFESLEDRGQELVGFYHSHPTGPAEPSETDRAMAAWPDRSYVIVSLQDGDARIGAWRWDESCASFERESIVLE